MDNLEVRMMKFKIPSDEGQAFGAVKVYELTPRGQSKYKTGIYWSDLKEGKDYVLKETITYEQLVKQMWKGLGEDSEHSYQKAGRNYHKQPPMRIKQPLETIHIVPPQVRDDKVESAKKGAKNARQFKVYKTRTS